MRRAAPAFFSGQSQECQSISLNRFEEHDDIGPSPSDTPIGHNSFMSPPSPGKSPRIGSQSHLHPRDDFSPELHDTSSFHRHHSQVELLSSGPESHTANGLGVFRTVAPTQHQKDSSWLRSLKSKWCMVICLFLGAAGALGHHILYSQLNNREATHQQWWLRLGQFLAFVAKANFVIAVLTAHQQVAWSAVSQKGYTVHAIDSLFGAAHNFIELFNKEAWKKSSFTMILAIYIWLSPLVVIFTSATLSVVLDTKREHTTCMSVRTLNFSNDAKKSWRDDKTAEGETMRGISLSMFNEVTESRDDPHAFDYWLKAAPPLDSIASRVLAGGQTIQRDEVAIEICGEGWDCSSNISFVGPGYECQRLAKGINSTMKAFPGFDAPFNLTHLVPAGNASYYTVTYLGEYSPLQVEVDDRNKPAKGPPFPENMGAFRTEPVIWLGYVEVDDMNDKHASNRSQKGWTDDYTPVITACEHWEIEYNIEINYTGGRQSYEVLDRKPLQKIINTTYIGQSVAPDDGTLDLTIAEPQENFIFPQDWERYRRIAAYHSLGKKLRDLLQGSIQLPGPIGFSAISTSKLVARPETLPIPEFEKAVRKLYEDLLISILSDPLLLAVAWASHPNKLSGRGKGGPETSYPCVRRRTASYLSYHWEVLVVVYAASFIVAAMAVGSGLIVMHLDGVEELREMSFSSIAKTTRNMDLDRNEERGRKIRAVEERPGSGLFEFRVEGDGRYDGSRTARF
ncbi:hypothetical protein FGRMN_7134 [Fusarium graminum]|nr:hypothetical protein FGRMN_7134 [Fusarium graminum]